MALLVVWFGFIVRTPCDGLEIDIAPTGARGRKTACGGDDGGRFTVWVLTSNWNLDRETAPALSANCVVMVECETFHFDIRWSVSGASWPAGTPIYMAQTRHGAELSAVPFIAHGNRPPDPRQRTWRQGRQSCQEREHSNVNIRVPALAGLAQHGRSQTIGFQRRKSVETRRRIAARVGTGSEDCDAIPALEVQGQFVRRFFI